MIGAAISAIANILQFSFLFGGDDDEEPLGFVGALAAIIFAPIAATILQLGVSRQREYLADATAATYIGGADISQALHEKPVVAAVGALDEGVQSEEGHDRQAKLVAEPNGHVECGIVHGPLGALHPVDDAAAVRIGLALVRTVTRGSSRNVRSI